MAPLPGDAIETIESRWGQSLERMFDTPESKPFAPDPHVWPAFLNAGAATVGYFRPPLGISGAPIVALRVNHGVWQTMCPFCPSAQHASKDDPWFYCAACHNEAVGLMSIPVGWPDDHEAVEGILLEVAHRPMRNWESDETVADLELQLAVYRASDVPEL